VDIKTQKKKEADREARDDLGRSLTGNENAKDSVWGSKRTEKREGQSETLLTIKNNGKKIEGNSRKKTWAHRRNF